VLHWIFRENSGVGFIILVGIVLYLIYKWANRR